MREHWIFHTYKWETYSTEPVFVKGFFCDYTLERRYQIGTCECGAIKYREIDIDTDKEFEMKIRCYKVKVAEDLWKNKEYDKAIKVLDA